MTLVCSQNSATNGHNEKPVHRNEEEPLFTATKEGLYAAVKIQHSQK